MDTTIRTLQDLGQRVDDTIASGLPKAISSMIKLLEKKQQQTEGELESAVLYYFVATALASLPARNDDDRIAKIKKQLFQYRMSLDHFSRIDEGSYAEYYRSIYANVLTNYGNLLLKCGRHVAAISSYRDAITLSPNSAMAIGLLGRIYYRCGRNPLDVSHSRRFHEHACQALIQSLDLHDPNVYPEADSMFRAILAKYSDEFIQQICENPIIADTHTAKVSKREQRYRQWVLSKGLFLNELNDTPTVGLRDAQDDLHISRVVEDCVHQPAYFSMINQIKQEYVYARYLLFEATIMGEKRNVHYADRRVFLVNSVDYPRYGIRLEHLRAAFLTLFNLFDRIAFLLNAYFKIGIKPEHVSFETVWNTQYRDPHRNGYLYDNPLNLQSNSALQALKWIHYDMTAQRTVSNPALHRMREIRHALTHRYSKTIDESIICIENAKDIDTTAFYVTDRELENYVFDLLKVVRESFIYTLYSIQIEEEYRNPSTSAELVIEMPLQQYSDHWKT